jgi:hypothetical protein
MIYGNIRENTFSPPCGPKEAAAAVVVARMELDILPPGRRQPLNAAFSNPFAPGRDSSEQRKTSSRHVLRCALYRSPISDDFFMTSRVEVYGPSSCPLTRVSWSRGSPVSPSRPINLRELQFVNLMPQFVSGIDGLKGQLMVLGFVFV